MKPGDRVSLVKRVVFTGKIEGEILKVRSTHGQLYALVRWDVEPDKPAWHNLDQLALA